MSNNKSELISKIRGLMKPPLLTFTRIDNVLRLNGATVSDAKFKQLEKRNRIRIYNIVPASKHFAK